MEVPPTAKTWYKKQTDAWEQSDGDILVKWGNFHFTTFISQDDFVEFIEETLEPQRQFYEVLTEGKPQRMFADLDGEGITINRTELLEQWETLMQQVFKDVGLKYNPKNVRILKSSGDKISFHWSYLGKPFKDCEEQKAFWKYVEYIIEKEYTDLCFLRTRADQKMELMNVLDISVYSKNRAFRTYHSTKAGSDRVLKPVKFLQNKIKNVSNFEPLEYLVYDPEATEFLELKVPEFQKVNNKFLTEADITKLIYQHVPNTVLYEVSGRMFKLKNQGTRACIINGEENTTDNSFVVWRRDGLYFGCHDAGCEGHLKQICHFNTTIKVDKKLTIDDFRNMAKNCKTYVRRLEIEDLLVAWMNETYTLVKANKTFIIEEYIDIDEDDNLCKGIKYKDINSFITDLSNKTLKTHLTPEETEGHGVHVKQNIIYPSAVWTTHPNRREVDKIVFDPKMFFDKPVYQKNFYNLFDGFEIPKNSLDDIEVPTDIEEHAFFKHILNRWCSGNKKSYNVILNMFAHILQKPWEKLQMSLILKSTMRTGKGIPLMMFKKILGNKYFFQPSKPDQALGGFNGQMVNCLVCFMDEMVWGGDKEKAGTIKKLVTENVNYINEKYTPTIRVKNLANVFMASNEDWVSPAGATEQRWLVENVTDELATCSKAQKNKIVNEILSLDIRVLAKFFYVRNLDGWSHRETVNTDGLREQKIQSLSSIHKWWLNCLNKEVLPDDEGNTWNDDGNFKSFIDKDLTYALAEKQMKEKHMNETKFWMEMKRILDTSYKTKRIMKNKVRRHYVYVPDLATCRKRWEVLYNDDEWKWENVVEELESEYESDEE